MGFLFLRLRKAPFEGAAIGIPPALPEDYYSYAHDLFSLVKTYSQNLYDPPQSVAMVGKLVDLRLHAWDDDFLASLIVKWAHRGFWWLKLAGGTAESLFISAR